MSVWNDANPTFNHVPFMEIQRFWFDNELGLESGFHNEFSNQVVTIKNSIIWDNENSITGETSNITMVKFLLIEGGFDGESNISTDPLF